MKLKFLLCTTLVTAITGSMFINLTMANKIHDAIKKSDVADESILVSFKDQIDEEDDQGQSPLELAIDLDRYSWIEALIRNNADVNHVNSRDSFTPLYLAAANGQVFAVQTLLEHNADVNLASLIRQSTPLHAILYYYALLYDAAGLTYEEIARGAVASRVIITELLKKGIYLNVVDEDIHTPLDVLVNHYFSPDKPKAVNDLFAKFDAEIIDELIKYGADVDDSKVDIIGKYPLGSPLLAAIKRENMPVVVKLLEHGADVNICDDNGNTPLHVAIDKNRIDIVKKLLEVSGVDVEMRNDAGDTPLYKAIDDKNFEAICLLLDAGANIKTPNDKGNTSLHLAIEKNNCYLIRRILNNVNFDINIKNDAGDAPIHRAVSCKNDFALDALINAGADVNIKDAVGDTPLHRAINFGNLEMVNMLLGCVRTKVNLQNATGDVPLHLASAEGKVDIMRSLLSDPNIDINIQNSVGNTPLHTAIDEKNFEAICVLLNAGADVTKRNSIGLLPSELLESNFSGKHLNVLKKKFHQREIEQLLANKTIHSIVKSGNIELITKFLERDIDDVINVEDEDGQTPLNIAINCRRTDIAELLLKKGAVIDKNILLSCTDLNVASFLVKHLSYDRRNELLFDAVARAKSIPLKALINGGVDVNVKDKSGKTLLNFAIDKKNTPLILELLDAKGIDVNLSNDDGVVPIAQAVKNKCKDDIVKKLLDKGARVDSAIVDGASGKLKKVLMDARKEAAKVAAVDKKSQRKADKLKQTPAAVQRAKTMCKSKPVDADTSKVTAGKKKAMKGERKKPQIVRSPQNVMTKSSTNTGGAVEVSEDGKAEEKKESKQLQVSVGSSTIAVDLAQVKSMSTDTADELLHRRESFQKISPEDEQEHLSKSSKSSSARNLVHDVRADMKVYDDGSLRGNLLFDAIGRGDFVTFCEIIKGNVSLINLQNSEGDTPLHLAIIKNNMDMIKVLLENDSINVNLKNHQGNTPLHLAVMKDNASIIDELLKKDNIDVNLKNNSDNTPLQLMIQNRRHLLVDMLLKKEELDVNLGCGACGFTPLHLAASLHNDIIVGSLLKCPRLKVDAKNKFGQTALEMVMDRNSQTFKLIQDELGKKLGQND